ncbi:MAG: hypothetical protein AAF999_12635 [Pseudomonadota bacterium]
MIRFAAILCVLGAAWAGGAGAQSVKLDADEIRDLLSGNTAIGRWDGAKYRQFFQADGVTIYAQEGARSARGQWRVDDAAREYQSLWPGDAAWEGWFVMEYGGAYYWVSKKTPPTPFRVVLGDALVALDCDVLQRFATDNELFPLNGKLPQCTRSRTLGGGTSDDCHWSFPYRSEAAYSSFARVSKQLQSCSGDVQFEQEPRVNHPDSYDQITATIGDTDLSLSLKDKAALSETLIFLRRSKATD